MKTILRSVFPTAALALLSVAWIAAGTRPARIEFTQVPVAGSGPNSRGDIAGKVLELPDPETYRVVLYAQSDQWYVQPLTEAPFTDVDSDGEWSNWTHLGRRYAALVVKPSFQPPPRTQSLPAAGGEVIAKAEVPARAG